jgi:UPF0176 protein
VILNISSYLFVTLPDAAELRAPLKEACVQRGLKGTILLAEEGINLFLAGRAEDVRGFVDELKQDARFAPLAPKESWSETVPFGRMVVKVKREIIRMDRPAIRPDNAERAPALPAETLNRWLDQGHDDDGRELVMLDTRNAFEVDYGTFHDAVDWRITKFSEFPAALSAHKEALKDKTVVSFCTGGIRCEKAAIVLREEGLNAFQLEGGILKYFEETDARHWSGTCFVFDEREALEPGLTAVSG